MSSANLDNDESPALNCRCATLQRPIAKWGSRMGDKRPKRFFVTIIASDRQRLRDVFGRGLDLFAARSDKSGHRVDGLITLEDVGELVEAGYQVLVAEMSQSQHKPRFIGAEEWTKGIREELEQQRKRR